MQGHLTGPQRQFFHTKLPYTLQEISNFYIKDNYEVILFINSKFASSNTNMLARLQNTFVSAFNKTKSGVLPRYILAVLDDDLITFLDFKRDDGAATLFGSWIEWLVNEFNTAIEERSKLLDMKFKKSPVFMY